MNVREQGRFETQASADVFLTSPWIPAEWVKAHGLEPRAAIFAPGFGATPARFGAGICAFAESTTQFTELPQRPVMVFTTHCDQLRRGFDSLTAGTQNRCFLFNLPTTTRAPMVQRMFRAELERLGKFLVAAGGHSPETHELEARMLAGEASRTCLRDAAARCSGREYAGAMRRFHWDGSSEPPASPGSAPKAGTVRLAVIGGPLGPEHALWEQLEAAGAEVVLNATEWGERSLGKPISCATGGFHKIESDPLDRLAVEYLDRCIDVFQRPNQCLYDWFGAKLRERQVQGIILWHYFGCDLWRAEAQTLRERFSMRLLLLEADESGSALERLANRTGAFVEALR